MLLRVDDVTPMMARCRLIAGFALLAAVADQADSLDGCFREDRPAG
jgi:hypothetical protein